MNTRDSRLVYSTDPDQNRRCPKCRELIPECTCTVDTGPGDGKVTAVLSVETSGRGGKTVTVIARLPRSESYLKELCTELKKKCGSGGTYALGEDGGRVEIQGDKREMIRGLLSKKGMQVKG